MPKGKTPDVVKEYRALWERANTEGQDTMIEATDFERIARKAEERELIEIRGADARGVEWRRLGSRGRYTRYTGGE